MTATTICIMENLKLDELTTCRVGQRIQIHLLYGEGEDDMQGTTT